MNSKIWSPSDATTREGETPMTRELSCCTEVQGFRGTEVQRYREVQTAGQNMHLGLLALFSSQAADTQRGGEGDPVEGQSGKGKDPKERSDH